MHNTKEYFREFRALKDVSFEIKKGETVGINGRNGSSQTNDRIAALPGTTWTSIFKGQFKANLLDLRKTNKPNHLQKRSS